MTTNSYLEYYLTLLAWIINNGIWSTLLETGIFAAPFAAIIFTEWLSARAQGADEGNKGILSVLRVENRLYVAYIVIIFACVPLLPISLGQLSFDRTRSTACGVSVAEPNQTAWGGTFKTIGDKSAHVPVWWWLVHALSKGISSAATAAIPCSPDIREITMEIENTRINDKVLLQELADFTHDCYGGAKYRLFNNKPDLTKEEDYDTAWIGSRYFLETPGYYDELQSQTPRRNWPYSLPRDEALAQVANGGGYPYCREWWSDGGKGLRARLIASVEPTTWTKLKGWLTSQSNQEIEDATLRQIVSPSQQARTMRPGEVYQEYGYSSRAGEGSAVTNLAANTGVALKGFSFFPSMTALRTALPMVQAFLIMGIIICLPLIMVISTYSLKAVMMTSFGLFTLHMLTFWWELARWVDSSMLDALYGNVGMQYKLLLSLPAGGSDATLTHQVMEFVMATMFLVLPGIFFAAMTWAGYAVGRGVDGMLSGGSSEVKQAGGSTASQVTDTGVSMASRKVLSGK